MKWKDRSTILSDELSRLSSMKDHELLSVPTNASFFEVKSAYRKMVKTYHPDKADPFMKKHNEQVVKLINLAYERLISTLEGRK